MILFRLVKTRYADSTWSGYGAQVYGGRWNHKGSLALYLSSSISLAVLENLVHIESEELLSAYTLFSIDIAEEDLQLLAPAQLPTDWRSLAAPVSTMDIGTQWLRSLTSVGLMIPSTIVPLEQNVLVNPKHPHFQRYLATVRQVEFQFDPRLKGA